MMDSDPKSTRPQKEPTPSGTSFVEEDNVETPPLHHDGEEQQVTTDTARQAVTGLPVLYVLLISLVAITLALVAYSIFWTSAP